VASITEVNPPGDRPFLGSVQITRTTALFPSAVFIQWDIVPDAPGTFLVDIYRSGSPNGPWETLGVALRDAYHFLDDRFNLPPSDDLETEHEHAGLNFYSLSRDVYYLITVTPDGSTAFSSVPTPIEPGLDRRVRLLKRKMQRDESVAFRKLNGIPLAVLKRKHWGTRCTYCYDVVTREATLEHCPTCLGTTFENGYWAPVYICGRRTPAPVQTQLTAHGDSDSKVLNFVILDYPRLEYKDVLVDLRRGDRYQVQIATTTELRGVPVHQVISASKLGRNSVEYSVLVDPNTVPPLY
jgi:hypothetical protein